MELICSTIALSSPSQRSYFPDRPTDYLYTTLVRTVRGRSNAPNGHHRSQRFWNELF